MDKNRIKYEKGNKKGTVQKRIIFVTFVTFLEKLRISPLFMGRQSLLYMNFVN